MFHQIPLPYKREELETGVQHWVGFQQHSAEALLQEALLVLEEDSQAAAGGGKVVQQLMADHEWSWKEEEAALYHEMVR